MANIAVTSGYGASTHEPFVTVEIDVKPNHPLQISPDEARNLAHNLLECAEAAEGDAFLVDFTRDEMGQEMVVAAAVMLEFRKWREKKRKK